MKFGIIGTGAIVEKFLSAASGLPDFELAAFCSRDLVRARRFSARYGAPLAFDSLEAMAASDRVEAVYVASPTALHCKGSIQMLRGGKHVLCEKAAATNAGEWAEMRAAAEESGRVLLEAARHLFVPALEEVRTRLPLLGRIRRVSLVFDQYSSRYDSFKAGIVENAFDPALSNGALMDIGVYCAELLVALFGPPERLTASCVKLDNGVDGQGVILAGYDGMQAVLSYSKIGDSVEPSAIEGEAGSLLLDHVASTGAIRLKLRDGREETVLCPEKGGMRREVEAFLEAAQGKRDLSAYWEYTRMALELMDEARRQQNIVFPADRRA